MPFVSNQTTFTQEQVDYLSSLHFINKIDNHLKAVSSINVLTFSADSPPRVVMQLEIYYNDDKVDTLSFDLHNYDYNEIIFSAKNIRSNEFIMQEIDNFLAGDVVE